MRLEAALDYLERSTRFEAVMYFEMVLEREGDLPSISAAAEALGWGAEINYTNTSIRVFRPRQRSRDLN